MKRRFLSVLSLVVILSALLAPDTATLAQPSSTDWNSVDWQRPPACYTDPAEDFSGHPGLPDLDLVGDSSNPAAFYQFDDDYAFFRVRIVGDPNQPAGSSTFTNYSWVALLDFAATEGYDYLINVTGQNPNEYVALNRNEDAGRQVPFQMDPTNNDDADDELQRYTPVGDYARAELDGTGYWFMSWAIPMDDLVYWIGEEATDLGIGNAEDLNDAIDSGELMLYFGTSADHNNYNKDVLDCYGYAELTVCKVVVNDDGGSATADEFDIVIYDDEDNEVARQTPTSNEENCVSFALSGGDYTIMEEGPEGYEPTYSGDSSDGTITLERFGEASVTITNNDAPHTAAVTTVTLQKTVKNDNGGTLSEDDFSAYLDGQMVEWDTPIEVLPGPHTVSEETQAGYEPSDWGGDCDASGNLSVTEGGSYICTIQNDDQPATLQVCKAVVNDNGGESIPQEWTIVISNEQGDVVASQSLAPDSIAPAFAVVTPCVDFTLDAGTYTITEEGPGGYTAFFSGGTTTGTITLGPGDEKHVTITNDDDASSITIVKEVINDDGGTLTQLDFQATLDGENVDWDTAHAVDAGSHLIGELAVSGYTTSFSAPADANGNIDVSQGESITVTITNDDQPSYIIVEKTVINDHHGTLTQDDFPVFIDGQPAIWGQNTVLPGTHAVSETTQDDYTASEWSGDCNADGSNVLVGLGETKTCSITNDDNPDYSISGYKYCCGEEGCTDTGVEGWEITLIGPIAQIPTPEQTTLTDEDGYYEFLGIEAGTYIVSETPVADWNECTPTSVQLVVGPGKGAIYSTPDETEYYDDDGAAWVPAVEAWEHSAWSTAKTLFATDADWVWNSYRVLEPVDGEVVDFRHEFVVAGTPEAGQLIVTADNGYEAYLNGTFVGSAQVTDFDGTDWQDSLLYYSWVDGQNWQSVETWDVSTLLVPGVNTLILETANEYMGPDDSPAQNTGTIDSNPGGVIYELVFTTEPTEDYEVDFCNSPAAAAESNSPVCEGYDIVLNGGPDGMAKYSWSGPDGWTSGEQNPVRTEATSDISGTYTVTVTSEEGCEASDSVDVLVVAPCTVDARDVTICSTDLPLDAEDLDFDCDADCCEASITILVDASDVPLAEFVGEEGEYEYTVTCGCPDGPCEPVSDSASLVIVEPCTVEARDVTVCSTPCSNPMLINEGFEYPEVTASQNWDIWDSGTPGLGWTVEWYEGSTTYSGQTRPEPAHLELHETINGWLPYEGNQYVELDSDWDGPGSGLNREPASVRIYQDVNTCPGQKYTLEYAWSPRPGYSDNQMKVFWNGVEVAFHQASGGSNTSWTLETLEDLEASDGAATRLEFIEVGEPDSFGMFLDAIALSGDFALTVESFDFDCETGCCAASITIDVDGVDVPLAQFVPEEGEYDYTVTCGCPDGPCEPTTDTATVTVVAPCPTPTAPYFAICVGTTIDDDLFFTNGATSDCGGSECCNVSLDYSGASSANAGTFNYTVTCGCPDSPCDPVEAEGTVTVYALPTVDAGLDDEFCASVTSFALDGTG
ncbi:MAG: hypothetical protein JW846_00125, partial [Dehalococcoidia bacterium]|nr:hypothetical protein [Dehalococcoidia bacterium]